MRRSRNQQNSTGGCTVNKRIITYTQAINEALQQEMERDPSIFVYGLDVADHKGINGTTLGLAEKFPGRCLSTPLSEEANMGLGLGAAINGLRPVNVHIRVEFLLLAFNQLVNMVSSATYGSNGKLSVPMVIRVLVGRGWGQGFQHSKSLQSIFAHIPGLKIIMPATPYDAKGMLIAAIRDDNPVICMEHRFLFWQEGEVPSEPYIVPLGKCAIIRSGSDITIAASSWSCVDAFDAANVLAQKHKISIELIDVRTIAPFDDVTVNKSVQKTGHCIVVDNDWTHCGFSAEVAARVQENCFASLLSPVTRIGFAPTHCPTTRPMEDLYYPNAETIIRATEKKLGLKPADLSSEKFHNYENKFKGPF